MLPIKRHGQFLLDKEPNKEDAKLRYRIRWNGSTVAFSVGYRINIDKWSTETQRCKNGTTHGKEKVSASEINKAIQSIENTIEDIFHDFESKDHIPSPDEVRQAYNVTIGKIKDPENKYTISYVCDKFIEQSGRENTWANSTSVKMRTLRKHLTGCFGDIPITNLNEDALSKFQAYLLKDGKRNSTISKILKNTIWFFRWAYKHKYIDKEFYNIYSSKLKGTSGLKQVIHLSWDELIKLYNLDIKNIYLLNVRDVFCFCCFTGLRYSDVAKLKRSDIHDDYISVVTEKTMDSIIIELNKYSKSLLDKYSNVPFKNDLALPIISNQKMNEHLKTLGQLAEFNDLIRIVYFKGNKRIEEVHPKWELLTTHCGRRTFVINALYLKIPAEVIMKWTGHSDYDSMKPYIEIVEQLKADEMKKFDRD